MNLESPAFANKGIIPRKYGYKNENLSIPLKISEVPENTKSLVLIMDDPDAMTAVGKVWVHWVLWNISPNTKEISENSIPENSVEFYKPIIDWLDKFGDTPSDETNVNIQLEYFNTSSSKCILDIFKRLELIHKKGNPVEINWYYEEDDEDMFEAGEDYQSIINIPFKMIEMEE